MNMFRGEHLDDTCTIHYPYVQNHLFPFDLCCRLIEENKKKIFHRNCVELSKLFDYMFCKNGDMWHCGVRKRQCSNDPKYCLQLFKLHDQSHFYVRIQINFGGVFTAYYSAC